jgi:hypothetical protein
MVVVVIIYSVFRRVSFNPSKPRNYLLPQVLDKLHKLRPCLILQLLLWLAKHLLEHGHQLRRELLNGRVIVLVCNLLVAEV